MRISAVSNPSLLTQTTKISALGSLEALSAFLVEANGKKVWAIKTQLSGAQANKALRRGVDGNNASFQDKDLFTRSETIWVDEDKAISEIKFYCINGESVSLQDFILAAPSKPAASGKRDVYQLFGRGLRISFEKTESVVEFAIPDDLLAKIKLPEGAQACLKVSLGAMDFGVSLSLKYEGQSAEDLLNQATLRQERMMQKKTTPSSPPKPSPSSAPSAAPSAPSARKTPAKKPAAAKPAAPSPALPEEMPEF